MTDTTTCPERVYTDHRDVRGHVCGRPVKDEGLCGIHLAGRRRRARNDAARAAERAEENQRQDAAQALCDRLAPFGIEAHPHYAFTVSGGAYTGGISIDPQNAAQVVTLVESSR